MNEGLEVNVAILRASTNSMSQNCRFSETPRKIENSYVFSIKINIRKLDTWWDQLHFLQVGDLRSNSKISKQYVAPPFGRIFEDDLVSGRFVIDGVFWFWNRQDIRLFILSTSPARFWKVWSWLARLLSSYPAMRQKPCSEATSLTCRRPPPLSVLLREKPWIWQGFLDKRSFREGQRKTEWKTMKTPI